MRQPIFAVALLLGVAAVTSYAATTPRADPAITAAVANPARTVADRARDPYRHPAQTLAFFGLTPGMRVVEYSPGGGWFSDILARLPAGRGSYTALVTSVKGQQAATALLAAKGLQGTVATVDPATGTSTVAPGSQDVVLTFRNIHNLTMNGGPNTANVFKAWFTMLKPGGILGIEEHRLPAAADPAREATSGYLKTATVRRLAEAAGFRFVAGSEINANPRDKADYPGGVWTLPPTYQLKDVDRAKYAAIGESDRMTLKFVRPN